MKRMKRMMKNLKISKCTRKRLQERLNIRLDTFVVFNIITLIFLYALKLLSVLGVIPLIVALKLLLVLGVNTLIVLLFSCELQLCPSVSLCSSVSITNKCPTNQTNFSKTLAIHLSCFVWDKEPGVLPYCPHNW